MFLVRFNFGGRVVPRVLSGAIAKSKHRGTYRDHHAVKQHLFQEYFLIPVGLDTWRDDHAPLLDQRIISGSTVFNGKLENLSHGFHGFAQIGPKNP